ncbi:BnaA09g26830D [Brassica napus]|uniref:BnaA09g26830D protein n=1 Tax=Brassica napus TaxID=3708 RepID=A0A078IGP9_BRANA|nr:BnaA09g26830D [Brassica napus]
MEIASSNLRYETKDVGCKSTSSSFLHINPKLRRDGKERRDVVMETPKKRKHSDEEKPPEKRQKKTFEALKSKFTEPFKEPVQYFTTLHDTKRKSKVITEKPGDKTETQDHSLKDLIVKAREKVQEKRQIDHRNNDIASQRITARLALTQMVKTVDFDDHLKYHMELEKLGCDFISDQVSCLYKFSLLSRSDYYIDESN